MSQTETVLSVAHRTLKGSVGRFSFNDQAYVVKRLQEKSALPGESILISWFARRLAQLPPNPPSQAPANQYELFRLQTLALAGVKVPEVVSHDQQIMVLVHCGIDGFRAMKSMAQPERTAFLTRLTEELARFHRAGHWHGGAQIKNILLHENGEIYRIDFEERFTDRLPLALAQVYDLILFLNSIPLAGPISEAESFELLPRLLQVYFAEHDSPAVQDCLKRLMPYARFSRSIARPFRRLSRKSIRRIEILVSSLETYVGNLPHA